MVPRWALAIISPRLVHRLHRTPNRASHRPLRPSARNGIGRKHRNGTTLDTKFRIDVFASVRLAPGLAGHIKDWMKISEPLTGSPDQDLTKPFAVDKTLTTRRFHLDNDNDSGCEAELADIQAGEAEAWSLCFETFGPPERRNAALQTGIRQLITEAPVPNGVEFNEHSSLPYPDWMSQVACQTT